MFLIYYFLTNFSLVALKKFVLIKKYITKLMVKVLAIGDVEGMRTKKPESFTFKRPIFFITFDKFFQIYPT